MLNANNIKTDLSQRLHIHKQKTKHDCFENVTFWKHFSQILPQINTLELNLPKQWLHTCVVFYLDLDKVHVSKCKDWGLKLLVWFDISGYLSFFPSIAFRVTKNISYKCIAKSALLQQMVITSDPIFCGKQMWISRSPEGVLTYP